MQTAAVIVAAGRGERAGGGVPKQWRPLAGGCSAQFAMNAFATHPDVSRLVLVLNRDDIDSDLWPRAPEAEIVAGGATRSASVLAGLRALSGLADKVLIHDAARPCVSARVISDVIDALRSHDAAAPAVQVTDALWRGESGFVAGTQDRTGLYRAQTPQGFTLDKIIAAHEAFPAVAADDVEIARRAGMDVKITAGDEDNLKITLPEDFARAEAILRTKDGYQAG